MFFYLLFRIEYFDDIANDPGTSVDHPDSSQKPIYEIPAVAHKNIHLMGVTLFCDEFPAIYKTVSRVISMDSGAHETVKMLQENLLYDMALVLRINNYL